MLGEVIFQTDEAKVISKRRKHRLSYVISIPVSGRTSLQHKKMSPTSGISQLQEDHLHGLLVEANLLHSFLLGHHQQRGPALSRAGRVDTSAKLTMGTDMLTGVKSGVDIDIQICRCRTGAWRGVPKHFHFIIKADPNGCSPSGRVACDQTN